MSRHPEQQYLDLMSRVLGSGDPGVDRTGVGTLSVLGAMMRFDSAFDGRILQRSCDLLLGAPFVSDVAFSKRRGPTETNKVNRALH